MRFRKLTFNDDAVYAGIKNGHRFWFNDWMTNYASHQNQKELIVRYEICKRHGCDSGGRRIGNALDFYNVMTGHRYHGERHGNYFGDFFEELESDFPHYECFDHSRVFKNSKIGRICVTSLVYLDTRDKIKKSCDKWGFDVEFIPYNGKDYHWMYVIYTPRENYAYRKPVKVTLKEIMRRYS